MNPYGVYFEVRVKAGSYKKAIKKAVNRCLRGNVVLISNYETDEVEYEDKEEGTTNYTVMLEVSVMADDCDEARDKALRCEPSDWNVWRVCNDDTCKVEYKVCMEKWATSMSVEELRKRATALIQPYKPFEIDGLPVFMNMEKNLLPKEIFKNHPKIPVEVSNLGRIRYNGNVLLQLPDENQTYPYGYLRVKRIHSIMESQFVHRLVAETWCEQPDRIYNTVHHISNNGMDNRPENLLWVTEDQHIAIHPRLKNLKRKKLSGQKHLTFSEQNGVQEVLVQKGLEMFSPDT